MYFSPENVNIIKLKNWGFGTLLLKIIGNQF